MSKKVLITGASGFIGNNLVKSCIRKGWYVRAFVLPNDPEETFVKALGAEIFSGDISDEQAVLEATNGIDIVFHCAGLVTDWAPKSLFEAVILKGTENVCEAAKANNVERLVYISTNDVFGIKEDVELTEKMPLTKWGEPYPDFKIDAENVVWRYYNEYKVPVTMVYPCWVYGIGDKTFVPLLADALSNGEMVFWRKDVHVWPTYIENLVDLLMLIAEEPKAVGKGFLVHDGERTSLQKFCAEIADTMGVKPPTLHLPKSLVYIVALFMEIIWGALKLKSRPLLTTYTVKNLGSRFNYSIKHAKEEINWTPKFSHKEGMIKTMEWLKTVDIEKLKQK